MSDDQQKEISSNGAVARAEQRTPAARREGVIALAATAMGALALGAISIGVLAAGKMAIGELSLGRARRAVRRTAGGDAGRLFDHIILLVLIPFFAFRVLSKALGEGRLERMFFVEREPERK